MYVPAYRHFDKLHDLDFDYSKSLTTFYERKIEMQQPRWDDARKCELGGEPRIDVDLLDYRLKVLNIILKDKKEAERIWNNFAKLGPEDDPTLTREEQAQIKAMADKKDKTTLGNSLKQLYSELWWKVRLDFFYGELKVLTNFDYLKYTKVLLNPKICPRLLLLKQQLIKLIT